MPTGTDSFSGSCATHAKPSAVAPLPSPAEGTHDSELLFGKHLAYLGSCVAGGLMNEPRTGKLPGGIVMAGPDTFGLPPKASPGSILRRQV